MKFAVCLLSGGLDSTTVVALAKANGFDVIALSFRYGQRHDVEIERAKEVAKFLGVHRHVIIDIDLRVNGGSALTSDIDVPKNRELNTMSADIPITYVPARNTIFLSYALSWAEVVGSDDIFIGVNALDYSGYPDCRPEYIKAYEVMANLATKASTQDGKRITIHTPLINLTKSEIIRKGLELGVKFDMTSSCYDPLPNGEQCGNCDSCILRLKGFKDLGLEDPLNKLFGK
jgi:7-cyano-7-deazaguanine synthase